MAVGGIVCLSNYTTTIAVLAHQMVGAWEKVWVCFVKGIAMVLVGAMNFATSVLCGYVVVVIVVLDSIHVCSV